MSSPSAPILSNAPRARDTTLEFYWYPPASSGDSAISSYTLACANPVVGPFSYPVGTNQALVTGLTNGTFYPFTTYATNVNGNAGPSAGFRSFAPGSSVPNQPLSTIASVIGTNSAIVSWNPPSVLPDSPINWYVIQSRSTNPVDPIQKVTADGLTQQSYLFTGLNSNSGYQFSVRSVNCPGYSQAVFTSSIAFQVVPDYLWEQLFTTASNGFVNYNLARLIANTPSGIGTSYRTTGQGDLYIPTSFTATNTVSYCASLFMSNSSASYAGIIFSRDGAPASGLNIYSSGTQFGYHWNGEGSTYLYNTGINVPVNTWTHVVLRITSSNAQWYINGNLSNTFVNSHASLSFTRMYVGVDTNDTINRTFPGYIDNCRFYTRALSATEITSIYQNTLVV